MNKSRAVFLIAIILILCCATAYAAQDTAKDISIYIAGKKVETDVPPLAVEGRTFVPVRSIFEKMGAEVTWVGSRQQVIIRSVRARIVLNLGSDTAYVDNAPVKLDVPPMVVEQRTLIPVRFVSEKLGYKVTWSQEDYAVYIGEKEVVAEKKPSINKIDVTKKTDSTVVTVTLSKMKKPDISYISDPMRFIADFKDVELTLGGSKINIGNKDAKEVRYALHPDYTRVVIEAKNDASFGVRYSGNKMIVTITGDDDKTDETDKDDDNNTSTKPDNDTVTKPDSNIKEEPEITFDGEYLVVIDAGHGGKDCGAIGYDEETEKELLRESKVNLDIALKVQKYLEAEGVDVLMTRSKDVALGATEMEDLLARSTIANNAAATLFVSIHINSFTEPTATGTEVLYADSEDKLYSGVTSKQLAENILTPLVKATGLENRGIKESPRMVVLRTTTMPSVLIETAFISNPEDRAVLMNKNKIDAIGLAIANGILKSLEKIK